MQDPSSAGAPVGPQGFQGLSREKPMETMVVTQSSGGGGQRLHWVEPGPLEPGRMRGFAKSGDGRGSCLGEMLALPTTPLPGPAPSPAYPGRPCATYDPVHGGLSPAVASVVDSFAAGIHGKAHLH